MQVSVKLDAGYLPDQYAKYAPAESVIDGHAAVSFPFEISDLPAGTKYLAWDLVDYDSIPVAGFAWIHWAVANVPVSAYQVAIPADFSQAQSNYLHGKNSLVSKLLPEADPRLREHYIGPKPPNCDHDYTLRVYALSDALDLDEGFYLNELRHQILDSNKVLASASLEIPARV